MTSGTPWEPPFAGTEVEHLVGVLDRLRTTFQWKADGLDAAELQTRVGGRGWRRCWPTGDSTSSLT